jgi:hypothetical protein
MGKLAEEGAQFQGSMGVFVFLDRQPDFENPLARVG